MGGAAVASNPNEPKEPFVWRYHWRALAYCTFFGLLALFLLFYSSHVLSVLYGYDGTYFTGILEMTPFKDAVGDQRDANGNLGFSSGTLSLLASIVQVGELVGSLSAGVIGTYGGRRGALVAACLLVSLGAIIQLVAEGPLAIFVVGRLILGMGIGVISNAVPLYLSEIPPAVIRGVTVGSWQLLLAIGQVIGAGVDQGTKEISNSASYRIPIGLNLFIPAMVFTFIVFIPESPRWLITRGKDDKARKALVKINKGNPTYDPEPRLQEFKAAHDKAIKERKQASGFMEIFRDPVEFRKLVSVFGILAGQQITGVQFIFSYATVLATNLQLSSPFLITIIIDIIEVAGVVVSFPLILYCRRKTLIWTTSVVMVISLLIVGGMGSGPIIDPLGPTPPKIYGQIAIAFICVFVFAFNAAWGPLAWALATECCPGPNRSMIMGIGTAAFWIVAWAVTFTLPYLYNAVGGAGLGLKIGYIYAGGCFLAGAFVQLYIGETKGRTLEEIGLLFARRIPVRQWADYQFEAGIVEAAMAADHLTADTSSDEKDKEKISLPTEERNENADVQLIA